jgi:chloramphenicol 3-O phosphotransferase
MNKVIIINGASCSGKTTIAKEICQQSNNNFVHLQIDKTGEFYSTIFPKGFSFAQNEIGTENDDDGLKGLFNNNRLARRKVVASILLATAKELLNQNFNIVIDTALDGPDAKELAQIYLKSLQNYEVKFVGIYCPLEERLNRLKTRTDNLFLTEDFIKSQTNQYDVFESCKELYDIWFDSSKLSGEEIVSDLLKPIKQKQKIDKEILIRPSVISDLDDMALLSKAKRLNYEKAQPQFWRYAGKQGDNAQRKWFKTLLESKEYLLLTAQNHNKKMIAFVIGKLITAPEVYDPKGLTLMIDDFCVKSENLWESVGEELIKIIKDHAKIRGATQMVVVCGAHDDLKCKFLKKQNLSIASNWFVGEIS